MLGAVMAARRGRGATIEQGDAWAAAPSFVEWFDYADNAARLADTTSWPVGFAQDGLLDGSGGPAASPTGKVLRTQFADQTEEPNRCNGSGTQSNYRAIDGETGWNNAKELWLELYLRADAGFRTDQPGNPAFSGCGSNPDLKLVFVGFNGQGRYEIRFLDNGTDWFMRYPGCPAGQEVLFAVSAYPGADPRGATWRRIRLHAKNSTTASSADGVFEVWFEVGGNWIKVANFSGVNTLDDGGNLVGDITLLALPANFNRGPDQDQAMYWGGIRGWFSDPTA